MGVQEKIMPHHIGLFFYRRGLGEETGEDVTRSKQTKFKRRVFHKINLKKIIIKKKVFKRKIIPALGRTTRSDIDAASDRATS